jgi:hypothetical protein
MIPNTRGATPRWLLSSVLVLIFALVALVVAPSTMSSWLRQKGSHPRSLRLAGRGFRHFAAATIWALAPEEGFPLRAADPDLTVHEWGTFTSIAGSDGRAMDWQPLAASTDLPSFVEHFREVQFKGGLRGTVRMETPVLYFYSPRETNVSVNVSFSRGLITEWYPHTGSVNADLTNRDYSLFNLKYPGAISWNSIRINPYAATDFPTDNSESLYYHARQTASAPVEVSTTSGTQREKFLFYRGVAAFPPPLTATLSSDGTVQIRNLSSDQIPNAILFEHRGTKLGYRVLGSLSDQAALAPPALDGSLDSLCSTLEGVLVSQGLFPDEAHAMLETWKTSWFEEGSRFLFIVPRAFVDSVLTLHIKPAPANAVRVFVGRLELVTPATEQAVESAFATGDRAALAKYKRFLEPITLSMVEQTTDESRQKLLLHYLDSLSPAAR